MIRRLFIQPEKQPETVAVMCVECRRPYWGRLPTREDTDTWHCQDCGDVIVCLVFCCSCGDRPVYAVPPDGRCEHCGEKVRPYEYDGDEEYELLRQLVERTTGKVEQ